MTADDPEEPDDMVDLGDEEAPAADTEMVLEGVKTVLEALKEGLLGMGLDEAANAITLEVTGDEPEDDLGAPEDDFGELEDDPAAAPAIAMDEPDDEEEEVPGGMQESQMVNEVLSRVVRRLRRSSRKR